MGLGVGGFSGGQVVGGGQFPGGSFAVGGEAAGEEFDGEAGDLFLVGGDGGEGGDAEPAVLDVVEAGDRHVVGHLQAGLVQGP